MNYPKINARELPKLVNIVEQAADDEKYLDPAACPYDEGTIRMIKDILEAAKKAVVLNGAHPEKGKVGRPSMQTIIPMEEVEKEIDEIRKELADMKIDGQTMEPKDRIQIIKTRAALIERVIVMKEQVAGQKQYREFVQVILGIMQDHLDGPEREKVLQELRRYAEQ